MTPEVTNGVEEAKTGQSSTADQENKQDAAATAPVQAAAKPSDQGSTQETAAPARAPEETQGEPPTQAAEQTAVEKPAPPVLEPSKPRTVMKPVQAPVAAEAPEPSGDIDFGAILEKAARGEIHDGKSTCALLRAGLRLAQHSEARRRRPPGPAPDQLRSHGHGLPGP